MKPINAQDMTGWLSGHEKPVRDGVYRVKAHSPDAPRAIYVTWSRWSNGYWHVCCAGRFSAERAPYRTVWVITDWQGITQKAHIRHLSEQLKPGTLERGLAQAKSKPQANTPTAVMLLHEAINTLQRALQLMAKEQRS